MYFRSDDASWLYWAKTHELADVLSIETSLRHGAFRPMVNLTWWILYHFCATNPYPYQLTLALTFIIANYFLYKIMVLEKIGMPGVMVAISFILPFYSFFYYLYWYSDLTFGIELAFMLPAIYCVFVGLQRKSTCILFGFMLAIISYLAKEPSILIVSLVIPCYILLKWKDILLRPAIKAIFAICFFLSPVIVLPIVTAVQKSRLVDLDEMRLTLLLDHLRQRYVFYSSELESTPAISLFNVLLVFVIFFQLHMQMPTRSAIKRFLFVGIGILVLYFSFALKIQFECFLILSGAFALLHRRVTYAIVWSFIPIVFLCLIEYINRMYLLELVYGLSIFLAFVIHTAFSQLSPMIKRTYSLMTASRRRIEFGVFLITILLVGGVFTGINKFDTFYGSINELKAVRNLHRESVTFISDNLPFGSTLFVIDEETIEAYAKERGAQENYFKIHVRKTMNPKDLKQFLDVLNRSDIVVSDLHLVQMNEGFSEKKADLERFIYLYNRFESNYLREMNKSLILEEVNAVQYLDEISLVYKIVN